MGLSSYKPHLFKLKWCEEVRYLEIDMKLKWKLQTHCLWLINFTHSSRWKNWYVYTALPNDCFCFWRINVVCIWCKYGNNCSFIKQPWLSLNIALYTIVLISISPYYGSFHKAASISKDLMKTFSGPLETHDLAVKRSRASMCPCCSQS